jgi:photosystem II stability/assembly factor-like uncharacterized protein
MKDFLRGLVVLFGISGVSISASFGESGWFFQNPLPPGHFSRVVAVDAKTAFLMGGEGTILRTDNGGDTWTLQDSGTTAAILAASFIDSNVGFAVVAGGILRTRDGGAHWLIRVLPGPLSAVAFADVDTWIAVGGSYIHRTIDGGDTWRSHSIGTGLSGVAFADANTGIAVGYRGIWRTTDAGVTWTAQDLETAGTLWAVAFADASRG